MPYLQYAPFHGLVADSSLKLDMQHERTTIGQRNVEDLVSSEHAAGQFHVERMEPRVRRHAVTRQQNR